MPHGGEPRGLDERASEDSPYPCRGRRLRFPGRDGHIKYCERRALFHLFRGQQIISEYLVQEFTQDLVPAVPVHVGIVRRSGILLSISTTMEPFDFHYNGATELNRDWDR